MVLYRILSFWIIESVHGQIKCFARYLQQLSPFWPFIGLSFWIIERAYFPRSIIKKDNGWIILLDTYDCFLFFQ
jgi:hypothetical protein